MRTLCLLALLLPSCTEPLQPVTPVTPDAAVDDTFDGTPGVAGAAEFFLEYGLVDRRIAAGGAASRISVFVRASAPAIGTITSSNPEVLEITDEHIWSARAVTLLVTSGAVGTSEIIISDSNNDEIDRLAVQVAASDGLALDRQDGHTEAAVLVGAIQKLHLTTMLGTTVLAGSGAVRFTLDPTYTLAPPDQTVFKDDGDVIFFVVPVAGTGSITASAPDVTLPFQLTAVDASEIQALTLTVTDEPGQGSVIVDVEADIGATPIYGALCTWTVPAGVTIALNGYASAVPFEDSGEPGGLGGTPALRYEATGPTGTYAVICTIPGGPSKTLSLVLP